MLIFCSHSVFYSRHKCQRRVSSGHEVPHALSCCTQSAFKYGVCSVTACCRVKESQDPSEVTEIHLSKVNCYGLHQ